jgi:DNA polymerase-3 subunit beta
MSETETIERPKGKKTEKAAEPAPRFTIERDAFLAAIRTVGQVVEPRNTIPILSNLLLTAQDGWLKVRGTDLNILAEASAPCDCSARLGTTVDEAGLKCAVETMRPEAVIEVTLEDGGRRLMLKHGRATRNLPTLPVTDFPALAIDTVSNEFVMEGAALRDMLAATSVAMSTDETARAYLCGVYLHAPDVVSLRAAATDGLQMVRFVADQPAGAGGMPGVILSRKTVALLRKLIDAHEGAQCRLKVQEKKILFEIGRVAVVAKAVEGTYPPYERAIPKTCDKLLKVHSAELRRCLSAAAALAETRGKARAIAMELAPDGCQARAASIVGAVVDPLDAEFAHEPMVIGMNERLAGPIVGIFGEAAQLQVAIEAPGKPIIISSPTKPAITAVLGGFSI